MLISPLSEDLEVVEEIIFDHALTEGIAFPDARSLETAIRQHSG